LAFVEQRIRELGSEVQQVRQTFTEYHGEVRDTIRDILTKAGIWEEINGLEQERAQANQRADARVKALQEEAQRLQSVRAFLLGREQMDPTEAEAPEEVPDEAPEEDGVEEHPAPEMVEPLGDSSDEEEILETPEESEITGASASKRPSPPKF
jgi:hypothetical protein